MSGQTNEPVSVLTTDDYRFLGCGERIVGFPVSEDSLNIYIHGWNDEHPVGCFSNYLVVPKYAATIEQVSR